ncbi:MAG: hypothetical protein WC110_11240 [Bacteroidales bacterium]|jgi:hypothetical protein
MNIPLLSRWLNATERSPRDVYRCTWSRATTYFLGVAIGEIVGVGILAANLDPATTAMDVPGLIYSLAGTFGMAIGLALYTHMVFKEEVTKKE